MASDLRFIADNNPLLRLNVSERADVGFLAHRQAVLVAHQPIILV